MVLRLCVAFKVAIEMRLRLKGFGTLRARKVSDASVQFVMSVEGAVVIEGLSTNFTEVRLKIKEN